MGPAQHHEQLMIMESPCITMCGLHTFMKLSILRKKVSEILVDQRPPMGSQSFRDILCPG